jgi:hypothetical protein
MRRLRESPVPATRARPLRDSEQPRPPIHIGGAGPKYTMPLVARYADVWNVPTYALRDWPALTGVLEKQCARVERNPGLIRRSHQAVLAVAVHERDLPDLRERVRRRGVRRRRRLHRDARHAGGPTGRTPDRASPRSCSWSGRNKPQRRWSSSPPRSCPGCERETRADSAGPSPLPRRSRASETGVLPAPTCWPSRLAALDGGEYQRGAAKIGIPPADRPLRSEPRLREGDVVGDISTMISRLYVPA